MLFIERRCSAGWTNGALGYNRRRYIKNSILWNTNELAEELTVIEKNVFLALEKLKKSLYLLQSRERGSGGTSGFCSGSGITLTRVMEFQRSVRQGTINSINNYHFRLNHPGHCHPGTRTVSTSVSDQLAHCIFKPEILWY